MLNLNSKFTIKIKIINLKFHVMRKYSAEPLGVCIVTFSAKSEIQRVFRILPNGIKT